MNLKEMVNTMMPSDRLIVKDTYGEELYRGYAANYDNTQQQALRAVQCHQISVDITKRMRQKDDHRANQYQKGECMNINLKI